MPRYLKVELNILSYVVIYTYICRSFRNNISNTIFMHVRGEGEKLNLMACIRIKMVFVCGILPNFHPRPRAALKQSNTFHLYG